MKVTVPLKYPVPLEVGHLIEVDVRRIRVRDKLALEAALRSNGSELEGSLALVAANTGLDLSILADMDDVDFATIVETITHISANEEPPTETVGSEE